MIETAVYAIRTYGGVRGRQRELPPTRFYLMSEPLLPIHTVLPAILHALTNYPRLVVQAPPGAGKTTVIPLAFCQQLALPGKLILIQPRRLAVHNAARRMAALLGETVGKMVGIRTRYETQVSASTRIEVVTGGIFLRQIQADPSLESVSCVLFDEFHERGIETDVGLAFALDAQTVLRDASHPLKIVLMSATLDGKSLAQWLGDAPLISSEGRCFPVIERYVPTPARAPIEPHITSVIVQALREESGDILVFLPGLREIRRVQQLLKDAHGHAEWEVFPLHASLLPEQQETAIQPSLLGKRKVVLATNVAETSITIEGVRIVIDSGLVRVSL